MGETVRTLADRLVHLLHALLVSDGNGKGHHGALEGQLSGLVAVLHVGVGVILGGGSSLLVLLGRLGGGILLDLVLDGRGELVLFLLLLLLLLLVLLHTGLFAGALLLLLLLLLLVGAFGGHCCKSSPENDVVLF